MARFIATIRGARGAGASRIGHGTSGITSHTRGWELGVQVDGYTTSDGDTFAIYATHGSGGTTGRHHLATITRNPHTGELRVTSTRTAIR